VNGTIYKRGKNWTIGYTVDGKQKLEATGTSNKRVAQKILNLRVAEIIEGRFRLPTSNAPRLEQFSQEFLNSIRHENTKKRYTSSVVNLRAHFGNARLSDISLEGIDEFKEARLADEVRAATVNRDLAVLRRMLRIAERKRLITSSPFREVEMLEERKERRQPHILTFKEEAKLLAVAPDLIRVLVILILETGLRSGREALALKWEDVDFDEGEVRVKHSKTIAGIRTVPMTKPCKAELLNWRKHFGPDFSKYVFANPQRPDTHLRDVRRAWPNTLKAAGLEYFWLYDLRHTCATRLIAAGVPPLIVAQMLGHSSTRILQTYAKTIDEYWRSAIAKLEVFREGQCVQLTAQQPQMIQ
jgi:integrase